VDVVFTPRRERWQGTERLELEILSLRGSAADDGGQGPEIVQKSPVS